MTEKIDITLNINGRAHAIRVEPRKTLVDAIREECGLTGTHIGCEHGVCGACTILVDGDSARACLMLAAQADGCEITTIQGLSTGDVQLIDQVIANDRRVNGYEVTIDNECSNIIARRHLSSTTTFHCQMMSLTTGMMKSGPTRATITLPITV